MDGFFQCRSSSFSLGFRILFFFFSIFVLVCFNVWLTSFRLKARWWLEPHISFVPPDVGQWCDSICVPNKKAKNSHGLLASKAWNHVLEFVEVFKFVTYPHVWIATGAQVPISETIIEHILSPPSTFIWGCYMSISGIHFSPLIVEMEHPLVQRMQDLWQFLCKTVRWHSIWRFPKMGVPPNHPFFLWDFPFLPFLGAPWLLYGNFPFRNKKSTTFAGYQLPGPPRPPLIATQPCRPRTRSLYIYVYIYLHTYIHTYIPTYKYTYIHTPIHIYIQIYIYTFKYPYIHTNTHKCIQTYI